MSDLVLYHAVPSRSITVHWMLEELGRPYEAFPLEYRARLDARPAWQRSFGEDQKIMAARAAEQAGKA